VPPGNLDLPNPGNNPVTNRFQPVEARFVRLRPTKLWKPFQHYPAFLALSEIQILNGEENLSSSAKVTPSENPNPFPAQGQHRWSKESLTDNHGPKGKLLTRKAWLELLEERKILEITRIRLASEIRKIERRWQFFISTGLGLIGVAGLLAVIILPIRFRLRERRKIRLIRDRIAGDLHDDVGSNLGSIQLLAGTAQTKTNNKKELQLINQVAAETVTSVRDIIWLLRPKPGTRKTTIAHLRESASFLLDPIDWKLTTDLEDFALSDEDGRNLVLFFREALHNLIRHSQADSAEIRIHMNNRKLCIEIEDDGCGIPAEQLAQEKTLRALKQRSKALRAHLKIDSKIDHGTRLELTFIPQTVNGNQALRYPFPSLSK
jgi:signal transduction histidine kinase